MIAGIVLAAGRSRRMQQPKALLELEGKSFLEHCLTSLHAGGCAPLLVAVGPLDDAAAARIAAAARALGARVVSNPAAEAEQAQSLCLALRALPPAAEAALVLPVDVPRVRPATVAAVRAAFRRTGAPLVLPGQGGSHGHPPLFSRALFAELCAGGLAEGARSVIAAHAAEALTVEVDDASILHDVDTPADYRRLLAEQP